MNHTDLSACKNLRKKIYLTAQKGGLGHLASCFSCVEILYVLYARGILRIDEKNPTSPDRDRLILSKGHAGLALFYAMSLRGLVSEDTIETFLQPDCHIGGEPCMRDLDFVEASTGSLGHGLSVSVGLAMAQKLDKSPYKTYCILGDGECEEGSVWEAAMSAPAHQLNNLVAILDCNEIQKMTTVEATIGKPDWRKKWEAFGWHVVEVDGHDTDALYELFATLNSHEKPTLVIAHTVKGKGVSIMENNPIWHFKLPNKRERKIVCAELDIREEEL